MYHISTEFCENRLSRFCIILLANKLADADDYITSLAEIIIRVLSFMLLIIAQVRVDRNEVMSTVFYILYVFVMMICLFLFQFSSRAVTFNKFELSWVEIIQIRKRSLFCVYSAGGSQVVRRPAHLSSCVQSLLSAVAAAPVVLASPARRQSEPRSQSSLPQMRLRGGRLPRILPPVHRCGWRHRAQVQAVPPASRRSRHGRSQRVHVVPPFPPFHKRENSRSSA